MTRAEKVAQAYGLRYVCGWKLQRIADELDVTKATVSRWLDPEGTRANTKRAKAKRMPASRQGEYVKRRAAGRVAQRERCEMVEIDRIVAKRQAEDDRIVEAWHRMLQDGSSVGEVARLLRVGKPTLLQQVQRLREEGRDLPYRHQVAA